MVGVFVLLLRVCACARVLLLFLVLFVSAVLANKHTHYKSSVWCLFAVCNVYGSDDQILLLVSVGRGPIPESVSVSHFVHLALLILFEDDNSD